MLPQNNPDRIRIIFDDHRLVANAGLLLPATLARQCPGAGQHRRQDNDPGCVCAGGRRLHRRRRCVAHRGDGLHPGLHGQGAIHPGHLPAQLPVGPRPSTRPGEPAVAGPGLGRRGGTRRRAVHHRPRFHHLRDLPTNLRCHAVTAGADSPS